MIGFESPDAVTRKLRERLQIMSDEELISFGKSLRSLCAVKRVSTTPNPFEGQLREARAEWRRRYPKRP